MNTTKIYGYCPNCLKQKEMILKRGEIDGQPVWVKVCPTCKGIITISKRHAETREAEYQHKMKEKAIDTASTTNTVDTTPSATEEDKFIKIEKRKRNITEVTYNKLSNKVAIGKTGTLSIPKAIIDFFPKETKTFICKVNIKTKQLNLQAGGENDRAIRLNKSGSGTISVANIQKMCKIKPGHYQVIEITDTNGVTIQYETE